MMLARFTSRYAIWIVVAWLVAAGAANLAVPALEYVVQSHSRSFLPADAPSSVAASPAAELFGESRSNNFNFIVLECDQPLNEQDRRFYDELIPTLRADAKHVNTVTDLWSDPATAAAGQSADRRAVTVMLLVPAWTHHLIIKRLAHQPRSTQTNTAGP
jgi:RND superfamily putative drug exporter